MSAALAIIGNLGTTQSSYLQHVQSTAKMFIKIQKVAKILIINRFLLEISFLYIKVKKWRLIMQTCYVSILNDKRVCPTAIFSNIKLDGNCQ